MTIKIHCISCGSDFTIKGESEPLFCCYCQSEVVLDFEDEEVEEDEDYR